MSQTFIFPGLNFATPAHNVFVLLEIKYPYLGSYLTGEKYRIVQDSDRL